MARKKGRRPKRFTRADFPFPEWDSTILSGIPYSGVLKKYMKDVSFNQSTKAMRQFKKSEYKKHVFKFDFKILPKQGAKVMVMGGHAVVYTPKEVKLFKKAIREAIGKLDQMILAPMKVEINAYFNRGGQSMWYGGSKHPSVYYPDVDNLTKGILDAMNEYVYYDDRYITSLTVNKYLAHKDYFEVIIYEIGEFMQFKDFIRYLLQFLGEKYSKTIKNRFYEKFGEEV